MNTTTEHAYTIVGSPKTRGFRIVWALEEMGIPYNLVPVPPQDEGIKKLNPSGKVPALIDHSEADSVVIDSVAIVQYLADKHQQLTYPAGTIKRAQQDSFTQFACDDMDGILWTVAKHTFVMPEELRATAPVKKAGEWDLNRAMKSLTTRLGDKEYVMGELFTVADLLLGHCAGWAGRVGYAIEEQNLQDYFARLYSRDGYKAAMVVRGD